MSAEEDAGNADHLPTVHSIGYGKPPVEHRFRKGVSGNPNGRPRKAKGKSVDLAFGMRPAEEYLKMEAYRPVIIREGDRTIELPTVQAVFRAMAVSAMKGNRLAQQSWAELITRLEAQEHASYIELLGKSLDYKIAWEREIERCRNAGLPEPTPIPHPDDMIINPDTGRVAIKGPKTKEQKQSFDEALARRAEAQQLVTEAAQAYRSCRSAKSKAMWLDEWHFEQRMFDLINEAVADRYKAKLENRSYAEGASREGHALEEMRNNKALRREYLE
ncbi:MAG: DUF5681 domain-containing protein [Sphingomonadaceae bacterium]